ncbi:hypothetical protein SELMODRAFT_120665 [Selaginella moellendorffii]|uniref:Glycosyltransferase 2-like domain-containing protein n=1 Tax=Selaginella moellendorffii TaxID=88036 RepID=D8SMW5_SELML|nr:uncharacterized protein LOC9644963 isoform X1 [Selaginella moellendorffii]EFJ14348.1 hypothetical protein SELMODRAFT_120665 [Selaginella moellendorffii]|eukprot:XP_002984703.1 uncharacterized protein LOC9644963 isoform X1 [Selaginella moellendorffii]
MGALGNPGSNADITQSLLWDHKSSANSNSNPNSSAAKTRIVKGLKLTAGLTLLQFIFAMYATFLLYFMSPNVDVSHTPWTSRIAIAQQWKHILWPTGSHSQGIFKNPNSPLSKQGTCQIEDLAFPQKKSNNTRMIQLKTELFQEITAFQQRNSGSETLQELLDLPSSSSNSTRITVVLNHFKRRTLCAQLDALLGQSLPPQSIWVLAFASPNHDALSRIVDAYNDSRIQFVSSTFDFKYYGRFQVALQADSCDFVYFLDDDMIPGRRMLEILSHVAGTEKYGNSVLGSIGRILPFRQKDFSFPSYRKFGSKEAGIYLPDPAYGIVIERIVQVDFLSSSWFLSAENVKALFIETPFTFATGEDLHLSYQMQKYRDAGSYVLPVDPTDPATWGDKEHRLAYVSETTVIHKDIVEIRDDQWWRALSRGYVTQWSRMNPQQSDVIFYAHTLDQVTDLAPLIARFRATPGKKAYVAVAGGVHCPCKEAAPLLGLPTEACHERRFKIFDLEMGSIAATWKAGEGDRGFSGQFQEIYGAMRGLVRIHSPAIIVTVADLERGVRDAVDLAAKRGNATLVELPRPSIQHALWMADLKPISLQQWNKMTIVVNIITQNRVGSLNRLLQSLASAHYLGDKIHMTFNMDSKVDAPTLELVHAFQWPHGRKIVRRRIIPGGLIRAVSESWYPAHDHEYGLLLEDDIEVSPFYYMWLKYALLTYVYSTTGPTVPIPELGSIALYTPRLVEVVKERPKWNATDYFKALHPNTPYLHQLPCSWGALFFPKHWREFYKYMGSRYTEDAKANPVQIPRSRTNGWQASWKKFLIDLMYLRGYVSLYPNFPNQTSFSTNHMEPGAHIAAVDNSLSHKREDFTVPLMEEDFWKILPAQRMPPPSKLPVINLFNQAVSIKGLKAAGAKLEQDVLPCNASQIVLVDHITGDPTNCARF